PVISHVAVPRKGKMIVYKGSRSLETLAILSCKFSPIAVQTASLVSLGGCLNCTPFDPSSLYRYHHTFPLKRASPLPALRTRYMRERRYPPRPQHQTAL